MVRPVQQREPGSEQVRLDVWGTLDGFAALHLTLARRWVTES